MITATQNGKSTVNGRLVALRKDDARCYNLLQNCGIDIPFASYKGYLVTVPAFIQKGLELDAATWSNLNYHFSKLNANAALGKLPAAPDECNEIRRKLTTIAKSAEKIGGNNGRQSFVYSTRFVVMVGLASKTPAGENLRLHVGIPLLDPVKLAEMAGVEIVEIEPDAPTEIISHPNLLPKQLPLTVEPAPEVKEEPVTVIGDDDTTSLDVIQQALSAEIDTRKKKVEILLTQAQTLEGEINQLTAAINLLDKGGNP